MKSKTPKSDALINALYNETGHVGPHNCPERWVKLCRELEEENALYRAANEQLKQIAGERDEANRALSMIRNAIRNMVAVANAQDHESPKHGGDSK
jgi:hypothetical protein